MRRTIMAATLLALVAGLAWGEESVIDKALIVTRRYNIPNAPTADVADQAAMLLALSGSSAERLAAIQTIQAKGEGGRGCATALLIAMKFDSDAECRRAAATAVGVVMDSAVYDDSENSPTKGVVGMLRASMEVDDSPEVRTAAHEALRKVRY